MLCSCENGNDIHESGGDRLVDEHGLSRFQYLHGLLCMPPAVIRLQHYNIDLFQQGRNTVHDLYAQFLYLFRITGYPLYRGFDIAAALRVGRHDPVPLNSAAASAAFSSFVNSTLWEVSRP